MSDPFDLQRFLDAQSFVYSRVLDELRSGRKQSHWIWFIFPQLAGLWTQLDGAAFCYLFAGGGYRLYPA